LTGDINSINLHVDLVCYDRIKTFNIVILFSATTGTHTPEKKFAKHVNLKKNIGVSKTEWN